jgi:hypothetical protein
MLLRAQAALCSAACCVYLLSICIQAGLVYE